MFHLIVFPHVTFFLAIIFVISLVLATICKNNKQEPWSLPILGHLHLLSGYEVPYQAFNALGKKYGPIIQLKLGSVKSLVVNGQENIREVLVTKGNHFDSRPDFQRYQMLFGGNKENCKYFVLCLWYLNRKYVFGKLHTHLETFLLNENSKIWTEKFWFWKLHITYKMHIFKFVEKNFSVNGKYYLYLCI